MLKASEAKSRTEQEQQRIQREVAADRRKEAERRKKQIEWEVSRVPEHLTALEGEVKKAIKQGKTTATWYYHSWMSDEAADTMKRQLIKAGYKAECERRRHEDYHDPDMGWITGGASTYWTVSW
jgi:hypothetical protein